MIKQPTDTRWWSSNRHPIVWVRIIALWNQVIPANQNSQEYYQNSSPPSQLLFLIHKKIQVEFRDLKLAKNLYVGTHHTMILNWTWMERIMKDFKRWGRKSKCSLETSIEARQQLQPSKLKERIQGKVYRLQSRKQASKNGLLKLERSKHWTNSIWKNLSQQLISTKQVS